jgi:hypothetical protein
MTGKHATQYRRHRDIARYVILLSSFLSMEQTMAQDDLPPGRGGNGGSARVEGNGLAIGGPGGRVSGDARGVRGGDGGDGGIGDVVVGGGGGHVAGPGVWLPPARSGYEIHQRALGLPVDPYLAQFGRGGAMAGYNEKLTVVDRIREDYLRSHSKPLPESMHNVYSVPLEYINGALQAINEPWRARIFDDQFEFFLPI